MSEHDTPTEFYKRLLEARNRMPPKVITKMIIMHPNDFDEFRLGAIENGYKHHLQFYGRGREKHIFYTNTFGFRNEHFIVQFSERITRGQWVVFDNPDSSYALFGK